VLTKEELIESTEADFMNEDQLEYIRELLLDMRNRFAGEQLLTTTQTERHSDLADRAHQEEQWMLSIRKRALDNDLLSDIDKALYKVERGEYGYCETSGEPIDIKRLLANPTSRTSVEEQERVEKIDQLNRR
jgi:DnaK suppressor protein